MSSKSNSDINKKSSFPMTMFLPLASSLFTKALSTSTQLDAQELVSLSNTETCQSHKHFPDLMRNGVKEFHFHHQLQLQQQQQKKTSLTDKENILQQHFLLPMVNPMLIGTAARKKNKQIAMLRKKKLQRKHKEGKKEQVGSKAKATTNADNTNANSVTTNAHQSSSSTTAVISTASILAKPKATKFTDLLKQQQNQK